MKYLKILIVTMVLFLSGIAFATQTLQITSSATPSPIAPGNSGFITLSITNVGTSYAETLKIKSIKLDSPIELKTSVYNENIGSLATNQATSIVIRFDVPSGTQSGFYAMEFVIEACSSSSVCNNFVHNVVITVQSPSTLAISSVEPTSLMAGETSTLKLTLSNHGSSAMSNVMLSWEESDEMILPLGSDNRKFISSIAGNSQVKVPIGIVVNPDATPGVYSLDIDIAYDDPTGTEHNISSTLGLRITGDFNFIVSVESQSLVAPGMKGTVNLKVANAGTHEAQFLRIDILESDPITQTKPKVVYIGNLESDDYETEKIEFIVGDASPGNYPLNIKFSYRDLYGNEYSDNYSLDVTVYSTEFVASQNGDSGWIFYIIIILIIAYLLYRKFRKKKR